MTKTQIRDALIAAREAAQRVAPGEDEGTSNRDSAVFWPGKTRTKTIESAAEEAGITINIRDWLGARTVFLHVQHGQGAQRTRMAEAAAKALQAAGLDSAVYYQMD